MLCKAQKNILIDFMNEHEELRNGKFTANFTVNTAKQLWEEVTFMLNSVPNGQTKEWKKWRKTWQDLKKNTKAKKAAINRHLIMTGGGPSCSQSLDDAEMEVLGMMNPVQIEGLGGGETLLQFSFNDIDENAPPENSLNDDVPPKNERVQKVLVVDNTINQVLDEPSVTGEQNDKTDEHNYNLKFPTSHRQKGWAPKKMTKTSRLQTSVALSQKQLAAINDRNSVQEAYYKIKNFIEGRKPRAQLRAERHQNLWWKHLKN